MDRHRSGQFAARCHALGLAGSRLSACRDTRQLFRALGLVFLRCRYPADREQLAGSAYRRRLRPQCGQGGRHWGSRQRAGAVAATRPSCRNRFHGWLLLLNNAALAAQTLRNSGFERLCVLDIDYHHGNGTQSKSASTWSTYWKGSRLDRGTFNRLPPNAAPVLPAAAG